MENEKGEIVDLYVLESFAFPTIQPGVLSLAVRIRNPQFTIPQSPK
jgi:hypothetical protein